MNAYASSVGARSASCAHGPRAASHESRVRQYAIWYQNSDVVVLTWEYELKSESHFSMNGSSPSGEVQTEAVAIRLLL